MKPIFLRFKSSNGVEVWLNIHAITQIMPAENKDETMVCQEGDDYWIIRGKCQDIAARLNNQTTGDW